MPSRPPRSDVLDDGVREMERIASAPRLVLLLACRVHRECVRVGLIGPAIAIAEHVTVRHDLVRRHHRLVGIAEKPAVHEREVPEVGEVLHLAGGVGAPRERPGHDDVPRGIVELGHVGQREAWLVERDPD